jgi:perosamine synthetase
VEGEEKDAMTPRVPVCEPWVTDDDVLAVAAAMRRGWISSAGPELGEFEVAWGAYCEMPPGVAVSSGTAALELAVAALGIGEGDEVICPTFTIIACVRAIVAAGAIPVLVDADPQTYGLDLAEVRAKVGPRTRAILAVHLYGHPVDAEALLDLASVRKLTVIEDAAEAHGAEALVHGRWRRAGGLGDVSIFSFYANKPVTTGEGGMVLAREPNVLAGVRSSMNLCQHPSRRFLHDGLGHNYRFTNMQAALGLSQLARIDEILVRKRRIAAFYRDRLGQLDQVELQGVKPWARPIHWMVGLVLRDDVPLDATSLAMRLSAAGVETRPYFLGMHEQPPLLARGLFRGERYPVAERLSRRGLYLPSGSTHDEATLARVCDEVRKAVTSYSV